MEASVFISIPEYLNSINFTNQNSNDINTYTNTETKCLCDVCQGYATVLYLDNYNYNYNYNPLKICKKKSKSFKKIETQFNYTNFPSYSVANLEELSLKSINPLSIVKEKEKEEEKDEELISISSNLTSPSLTSSLSFNSFRSSPDLFQELLCLECGNDEYCECFSDKYSQYEYDSFKKIEEIEEKKVKTNKFYDYPYDFNFYDEKKDCDCNLICYDSDCDCHFYEA